MDSFIREVLRMHPIAIQVVNRQCMKDTHVAGYDIEKGFYFIFKLKKKRIISFLIRFIDSS
jgi:cytochrome P450